MGYNILELRPELKPDLGTTEPKCPDKLQPLSGSNIPLRSELGNPGEANQDELANLNTKARHATDEARESWTAADLNNLACACSWSNLRDKANFYFEEALKKSSLSEEEKRIITCNLNLLKSSSTEDGKE